MTAHTEQQVLDRIRELCPCRDDEDARRVLGSTLQVLGEQLFDEARTLLARELPSGVAALLGQSRRGHVRGLREFFARVSRREGTRIGIAVEHAEVVCRVLSDCVNDATLERLRREARELASLFTRSEALRAAPERAARDLEPAGPLPRPHQHSVAASDHPHSDTRISSAPGLSQEREGETLATGRPGSRRPLSEGRG